MMDATIIERARKLLSLSHSPNEHEAALAAEKLQELLLRHNLTAASIPEGAEDARGPIREEVVGSAKRGVRWRDGLLTAVAQTHLCECFFICGEFREAVLVGREANTAVAREVFEYLAETVDRLAQAALRGRYVLNPRAWGNSFRLGCVYRLSQRLLEHCRQMESEGLPAEPNADACTALVVAAHAEAERGAVANWLEKEHGKLRNERRPRIGEWGGYAAGRDAAEGISLAPQLSGSATSAPLLAEGGE